MINRILVVCTGNICRSPIAEAMLARRLPEVTVGSAGVAALVGHPAAPAAVTAAAEAGLDLAEHRARQVDRVLLQQHDLVLTTESQQLDWIEAQFPLAKGRVFLLSRWSDQQDLPDPYGRDVPAFRQTVQSLKTYVEGWAQRVDTAASAATASR